MPRLLVAGVLVVVIATVASIVRGRRAADAPSQPADWRVPAQLDRADFPGATTPWLVVVFSSATCDVCASMVSKAQVLSSSAVSVVEAEYGRDRALHDRYHIDAVPTTVVADADGVVRASFLGPTSATDLWAAVAEAREPGTRPGPCEGHGSEPH